MVFRNNKINMNPTVNQKIIQKTCYWVLFNSNTELPDLNFEVIQFPFFIITHQKSAQLKWT